MALSASFVLAFATSSATEDGKRGVTSCYFNPWSVVVGLVIPFVAIVGGVAVLGRSEAVVLGMPVVYFWVFLWFVLTTLCLAASWYLFDRRDFEDEEAFEEQREEEGEV
jgi:nitrate/nitrite transporter NarK